MLKKFKNCMLRNKKYIYYKIKIIKGKKYMIQRTIHRKTTHR
jgi:hypothetical protein